MKIFSLEVPKSSQSAVNLLGVSGPKGSETAAPVISFEAALSTASPASPNSVADSGARSDAAKVATPFAPREARGAENSAGRGAEARDHEVRAKTPQDKPMLNDYSGRRSAGRHAEKQSDEKQADRNLNKGVEDSLVVGGVSSDQPHTTQAASKLKKQRSESSGTIVGEKAAKVATPAVLGEKAAKVATSTVLGEKAAKVATSTILGEKAAKVATSNAAAKQGQKALLGGNPKNMSQAGVTSPVKDPASVSDSPKTAKPGLTLTTVASQESGTAVSIKGPGSGDSGNPKLATSSLSKPIPGKNGEANRSPAGVAQPTLNGSKTALPVADSFQYSPDNAHEAGAVLRAVSGGKPVPHTTSGAAVAPGSIAKNVSVLQSPIVEGASGKIKNNGASVQIKTTNKGSLGGAGESGKTAALHTGKTSAQGSPIQPSDAANRKKAMTVSADGVSENGSKSEKVVRFSGKQQAVRAASEVGAKTPARSLDVIAKSEISVNGERASAGQIKGAPSFSRTPEKRSKNGSLERSGVTSGASGSKVKNVPATAPLVKGGATASASASPTPEAESLGSFADPSDGEGEFVSARSKGKEGKKPVDSKLGEITKAELGEATKIKGRAGRNAEVKAVPVNPSDSTKIKTVDHAETKTVQKSVGSGKAVQSESTESRENPAKNALQSKPSSVPGTRSLAGEGEVAKSNGVNSKTTEVVEVKQTVSKTVQKGVGQRPVEVVSKTSEENRTDSNTAEKVRISQNALRTPPSELASFNESEKSAAILSRKHGFTVPQEPATKSEGNHSVNKTSKNGVPSKPAKSEAQPTTARSVGSVGSSGKEATLREVGTSASQLTHNGRVANETFASKVKQLHGHQAKDGTIVSEVKSGKLSRPVSHSSKATADSGTEAKSLQAAKSEAGSQIASGKGSSSGSTGKKNGGSQSGKPKQGGTVVAQQARDMARKATNEFSSRVFGQNIPDAAKNDTFLGAARRTSPLVEQSLGANARASELAAKSGGQMLSSVVATSSGRMEGMSESGGVGQSRLTEQVLSAVDNFRNQGARDWQVRLRADQDTELNLRMRFQDNQLVVQARMEAGRPDLIAPRWGELQQILADRGVQLQHLESGAGDGKSQSQSQNQDGFSQFNSNGFEKGESFEQQQKELELLTKGSLRSGRQSGDAEPSSEKAENSEDGWQTWA